jgi:hypothetical protein
MYSLPCLRLLLRILLPPNIGHVDGHWRVSEVLRQADLTAQPPSRFGPQPPCTAPVLAVAVLLRLTSLAEKDRESLWLDTWPVPQPAVPRNEDGSLGT